MMAYNLFREGSLKKGSALFAAFAVSLLVSACSEPEVVETRPVVRPVKLFTVSADRENRYRTLPARVVASEATQLSFRIPGELVQLPVKEGQQIDEGSLIAKLDDTDLKNQLTQAEANFELAQAEFKRKQNLLAQNIISKGSFDQVKTALTASEVALKLARDNVRYATITAPFAGRIARVLVENHQFVQAKQPIVILQTVDTIDLEMELPESIIANIKPDARGSGYRPEVRFQSVSDRVFYAKYKEHATEPTPGTQSYRVTLTMPKPESLSVLPGMTASVTLDLKAITNLYDDSYLVVPVTALVKDDASGDSLVWKYDAQSGTVQPVKVVAGELSDDGIEVKGELKPGDQIVSAGVGELVAGMQVKPLSKPRGL